MDPSNSNQQGAPAAPPKNPHVLDPQALKDLWKYNLTNHKPTPEAIKKIESLRSAAIAMSEAIISLTPGGRDQALALTSLEQMLFHGNAAIARADNEDIAGKPAEDQAAKQQTPPADNDQTNSDKGEQK